MSVLSKRTWGLLTKPLQMRQERKIEVLIDHEGVTFLWNDPEIQEIAEELGEPIFKKPRPCG